MLPFILNLTKEFGKVKPKVVEAREEEQEERELSLRGAII